MLPLSEADVQALHVALEHVYRSSAIHDRIIRDFGPAPLLDRIRDVEAGHIQILEWLHRRYGVVLLKEHASARIPHFIDAAHACAQAIEAEKERLVLYRRLIEGTQDPDVRGELRNLERASRDGHLPALHAWARQLGRHEHARAGAAAAPPGDYRRARVGHTSAGGAAPAAASSAAQRSNRMRRTSSSEDGGKLT